MDDPCKKNKKKKRLRRATCRVSEVRPPNFAIQNFPGIGFNQTRTRKKEGHAGSTDTGKSNQLLVRYYVTCDGCATWPEWAGTALHLLEFGAEDDRVLSRAGRVMREFLTRQEKGGSLGHAKMDLWWGERARGSRWREDAFRCNDTFGLNRQMEKTHPIPNDIGMHIGVFERETNPWFLLHLHQTQWLSYFKICTPAAMQHSN